MGRAFELGIIGDYNPDLQSHAATNEAIEHSAVALSIRAHPTWLPTQSIEDEHDDSLLRRFDAFWCAPGSPYKSMGGALKAIQYAREHDLPFLGTCGGFQHTLLEYARNVLGIIDADHEELSPNSNNLFISKLSCSLVGKTGTIKLLPNTLAYEVYKKKFIKEQFRCNYGLNPSYMDEIDKKGLVISGLGPEGEPRIIELRDHRFFVATLFLPQLSSSISRPHPLINKYLQTASA